MLIAVGVAELVTLLSKLEDPSRTGKEPNLLIICEHPPDWPTTHVPPPKMSLTTPEKTAIEVEAQAHSEKLNNAHVVEIDAAAQKKLLRKLDWHLIPPLMTVYFLSFMDRTNIGASLHGLSFPNVSTLPSHLLLTTI